jgi:hypothetical protein
MNEQPSYERIHQLEKQIEILEKNLQFTQQSHAQLTKMMETLIKSISDQSAPQPYPMQHPVQYPVQQTQPLWIPPQPAAPGPVAKKIVGGSESGIQVSTDPAPAAMSSRRIIGL